MPPETKHSVSKRPFIGGSTPINDPVNGWYRWYVYGHYEDVKYPQWPDNGQQFVWNIPSIFYGVGGGRYAFLLKEVR